MTRLNNEARPKRWLRIAALVLAACGLAVGVAACGSSSKESSANASSSEEGSTSGGSSSEASSSAQEQEKQYVVGFSNPQGAQPILHAFQEALVAAGKNLNIKVVPIDAQLNPSKQVSDVNQMVAEKVNGIIAFPLAPNTLNPALERAKKEGIKTLGFNAIVEKPKAGASVAPYEANFDQGEDYGGAEMLARHVAEQLHKGPGNVLGVTIGVPVPSLHFMVKQYQVYLKKFDPKAKWLETVENKTDNIAGGEQVVANALTKYHNNIQAVMAYNDDSAVAAAIAFKDAGINPKTRVIVGQNGGPTGRHALEKEEMSAMVDIVPWREALIAATMMHDMLTGKTVPNWVETQDIMYTKSNISEQLLWPDAVKEIEEGKLSCEEGGGCPSSITP